MYGYSKDVSLDYLLGKTIVLVVGGENSNELVFNLGDGESFVMYHRQDCCESVYVGDITGDFASICDSPVLRVFENVQDGSGEPDCWGSRTYTFYTITTFNGSVTIRWIGESNGYYSESVSCCVR